MRLPNLGIFKVGNIAITGYQILSIVITLLTLVVAHIILHKTKGGTHVRAVTQNPSLSELIGINVHKIYLLTAAISGLCAYLGAVLWGEVFSLELGSGVFFTLYGFIIAVMGGLGSVYGALFVSLILGFALSATSFWIGGVYEHIITTLILVVILILKPKGVIPTRREV
jgi:branched-chain amino acid transport system permease protein